MKIPLSKSIAWSFYKSKTILDQSKLFLKSSNCFGHKSKNIIQHWIFGPLSLWFKILRKYFSPLQLISKLIQFNSIFFSCSYWISMNFHGAKSFQSQKRWPRCAMRSSSSQIHCLLVPRWAIFIQHNFVLCNGETRCETYIKWLWFIPCWIFFFTNIEFQGTNWRFFYEYWVSRCYMCK